VTYVEDFFFRDKRKEKRGKQLVGGRRINKIKEKRLIEIKKIQRSI